MSGRQDKIFNEQAKRYGLPLDGPMIDLPQFVAALHDFLAQNQQRLAQDDDPLLRAGTSPALERYREEKAKLAMLDRLERERKRLPLDDVQKMLIPFCDTLRNMAERLGRYYGVEAMKMYIEAVEEAKQIVEASLEAQPEPFDALYQQQEEEATSRANYAWPVRRRPVDSRFRSRRLARASATSLACRRAAASVGSTPAAH